MRTDTRETKVRVGLVGAGIFARTHARSYPRSFVEVVVVYSRSEEKARRLRDEFFPEAGVSSDLDSVLEDKWIDAVDVLLPIAAQPAVVAAALKNGKYVLSEKPAAPSLAAGEGLDLTTQRWAVAENYRMEPAFDAAAGLDLGLLSVRLVCGAPIPADSPYAGTEWRRVPEHVGGYLGDVGVHLIAALRRIVGAESWRVVGAATSFTGRWPHLPSPEAMVGVVKFGHVVATLDVCFRPTAAKGLDVILEGATGRAHLRRVSREGVGPGYELHCERYLLEDDDENITPREEEEGAARFFAFAGVERELEAFFDAVRRKGPVPALLDPRESLADLAILEALLEKAAAEGELPPRL